MPSRQRGRIEKLPSGRWSVRFYDEAGERVRQGGFATKSEAGEWLERRLGDVQALRRGDASAVARAEEITFAELVDRFLAAHEADEVTIAKLRSQLASAVGKFGQRPIRTLRPDELGAWRKTIGNRHHTFRAVKQVLAQAERWEWLERSPATSPTRSRRRPRSSRSSRGRKSRRSPTSSTPAFRRSRSSPSARAYVPRNGSRSSAATSTAAKASSMFGASTRRGS
jgi:hypothetical protein